MERLYFSDVFNERRKKETGKSDLTSCSCCCFPYAQFTWLFENMLYEANFLVLRQVHCPNFSKNYGAKILFSSRMGVFFPEYLSFFFAK